MKIKINYSQIIIKSTLQLRWRLLVSLIKSFNLINFTNIEKPEDKLFEQGVLDLTNFIDKINLFEKITN